MSARHGISRIDYDAIPPLDVFLTTNGIKYQRGRGDEVMVCCPFHGEKRPSLSVNLRKGLFFCHVCGAKGGGTLSFAQQLHRVSRIQAAKLLGVYRRDPALRTGGRDD